MFVVAALYQFADLEDPELVRIGAQQICDEHSIRGTLIFAHEGINGTIAGTRKAIDTLMAYLYKYFQADHFEYKESVSNVQPFHRLKLKLKAQIVTMGEAVTAPRERVGIYVEPEDWNQLIRREDVLLIDTRNEFEIRVGRFKGATDPHTTNFSEFPEYTTMELDPAKHKRIAMYCTGGIRCEKATSHLLHRGFEEVYHLHGGILRYLERIPREESLWEGECFVFDGRVSLTHGLREGTYELCYGCQQPVSEPERQSASFERGVSCPYCHDVLTEDRKTRLRERGKQENLAAQDGRRHIGQSPKEMRAQQSQKNQRKEYDRKRN